MANLTYSEVNLTTLVKPMDTMEHENEALQPSVMYTLTTKHWIISVLAILPVLFNGMLILLILRKHSLRSVNNIFITALAIADFTTGFPSIPLHILAERWGLDPWACLACMGLTASQIIVSVLMMFALSIERYLNIVEPFHHRRLLTVPRAGAVITVCWIYALSIGLAPLLGWNTLDENWTHGSRPNTSQNATVIPFNSSEMCRFEVVLSRGYIALVFMGHVVPASIVLPLLHLHVFTKARSFLQKHMRDRPSVIAVVVSDTPLREWVRHMKKKLKPFKILVIMVMYFIVSWLPLTIWEAILFKGFLHDMDTSTLLYVLVTPAMRNLYYVACGLAILNSTVNPLIYGFGNRAIFQMMKRRHQAVDNGGISYREASTTKVKESIALKSKTRGRESTAM